MVFYFISYSLSQAFHFFNRSWEIFISWRIKGIPSSFLCDRNSSSIFLVSCNLISLKLSSLEMSNHWNSVTLQWVCWHKQALKLEFHFQFWYMNYWVTWCPIRLSHFIETRIINFENLHQWWKGLKMDDKSFWLRYCWVYSHLNMIRIMCELVGNNTSFSSRSFNFFFPNIYVFKCLLILADRFSVCRNRKAFYGEW